ncbi:MULTISPECIES: DUF3006 domain-containing protein [Clostridium]|uniref:DUF3006 domain-containing protein n=1 Tax=Clostridium senegalense TaxID=1465809 RepID=A0A6M0H898_9CLOT|nr:MULTISPECIES: DUF3006 domain-containing protein [Clostridium]NEU06534.1 DUF3006 domain-containing protein [Clostridium senegalense]
MNFIIDRFEGEFAVCEKSDRNMVNIKIKNLPKNAREGDVIILKNDIFHIDIEETIKRRKEIEELSRDLWNE